MKILSKPSIFLTVRLMCLLSLIGLQGLGHSNPNAAQQKKRYPIEKEGLLRALSHKVLTVNKLIQQIKSRGVNFEVTPENEQEIRRAGKYLGNEGVEHLIAVVRENFRVKNIQVAKKFKRILLLVEEQVNEKRSKEDTFVQSLKKRIAVHGVTPVSITDLNSSQVESFRQQLQKVRQGHKAAYETLPFAVVVTGTISVTDVDIFHGLYSSTVNGTIDAIAVDSGITIAVETVSGRGYGNTFREARSDAIIKTETAVSDSFILRVLASMNNSEASQP